MADHEADYVSAVDGVIGICKDAEEGFAGAATAVKDPALKNLFETYSRQRAGFAGELRLLVEQTGNKAADPSGIAGNLHRGWIVLKGALTGHSEHQILVETERGEDLSLKHYRDALSKALAPELRSVVQRQYEEVQQAHNRIKSLRDQTGVSSSTGSAG